MAEEVEYVATVRVERVVRWVQPKGTPTNRRSVVTSEDKIMRDRAEVLSFTARADGLIGIRSVVTGMMTAGLQDSPVIKGDAAVEDDDEEEDF